MAWSTWGPARGVRVPGLAEDEAAWQRELLLPDTSRPPGVEGGFTLRLNVNQLQDGSVTVGWGGKGLPHERTVETAAGKIIKGLTAILVGHLLFNQSVSSISCSPEASGPKFLCLLQHMVAEACHEKLIILQGRVILFIWVRAGDRPFPGVAFCASISGRGSTPTAGREELCYHLQMGGTQQG